MKLEQNGIFYFEFIKNIAPFLTVVFFYAFVLLMLRGREKKISRWTEYGISATITAGAYFAFIKACGLARYDYVFDVFYVVKDLLIQVAISIRVFLLLNKEIIPLVNSLSGLINAIRFKSIGLNKIYVYGLKLELIKLYSTFVADLKQVFSVFKKDVTYKNNLGQQELCVFRC